VKERRGKNKKESIFFFFSKSFLSDRKKKDLAIPFFSNLGFENQERKQKSLFLQKGKDLSFYPNKQIHKSTVNKSK